MTIVIILLLLAWPAVTWWMESRQPQGREITRMADRDRITQARRAPHRRGKYSQTIKPALFQQHGRPTRGR